MDVDPEPNGDTYESIERVLKRILPVLELALSAKWTRAQRVPGFVLDELDDLIADELAFLSQQPRDERYRRSERSEYIGDAEYEQQRVASHLRPPGYMCEPIAKPHPTALQDAVENVSNPCIEFSRPVTPFCVEGWFSEAVLQMYGVSRLDMNFSQLGDMFCRNKFWHSISHAAIPAAVAYQNTVRHRLAPLSLVDRNQSGFVKMLVFYLAKPDAEIYSTKSVSIEKLREETSPEKPND